MKPIDSNEGPLVRVATAPNEPLARMWAEALENEGISCLVKMTGGPGIAGVWAGLIVEHELWVRESQAEEAKALLREFLSPEEGLDEGEEDLDGEDG